MTVTAIAVKVETSIATVLIPFTKSHNKVTKFTKKDTTAILMLSFQTYRLLKNASLMSSRTTTVENAPTDSLSTTLIMETVTAVKPLILMPLVPVTFTKLPVPVQPLLNLLHLVTNHTMMDLV
jgi:hypothetical protein